MPNKVIIYLSVHFNTECNEQERKELRAAKEVEAGFSNRKQEQEKKQVSPFTM